MVRVCNRKNKNTFTFNSTIFHKINFFSIYLHYNQKLYRQFETIALRKTIVSPLQPGEAKQAANLTTPKNANTKASSATTTSSSSSSSSRAREKRKLASATAMASTDVNAKKRRSRSITSEQDTNTYVN